MKKSTANHMHRKRRKNNLTWLFALLGILVLFLGTILAFLIFSNLSSKPTETVQEVSAVNVEKDIPETDMGDLIYHEPAAENVECRAVLDMLTTSFWSHWTAPTVFLH